MLAYNTTEHLSYVSIDYIYRSRDASTNVRDTLCFVCVYKYAEWSGPVFLGASCVR